MWYVIGIRKDGERVMLAEMAAHPKAVRQAHRLRQCEDYQSIEIEGSNVTSNGRTKPLTLKQAVELTPTVNPVEALKNNLQLAVFDAVGEQDIRDIVLALKKKALAGDAVAIKMLLNLVLPSQQPAKVGQAILVQVDANGQRLRPEENYKGPAAKLSATEARAAKLAELEQRAANGEELFPPKQEEDEE